MFGNFVGGNYVVYNYVLDVVPEVPAAFGYSPLPNVRKIQPNTAQADIKFDIACNHHIVCYLAMLDYTATMAAITPVPAGEEGSATCIRGPNAGQVTLAKSLVSRILEVAEA